MAMRISLGHIDEYDDRVAAFARQLGLSERPVAQPDEPAGQHGYWSLTKACGPCASAVTRTGYWSSRDWRTSRPPTSTRSSGACPAGTSRSRTTARPVRNLARAGIAPARLQLPEPPTSGAPRWTSPRTRRRRRHRLRPRRRRRRQRAGRLPADPGRPGRRADRRGHAVGTTTSTSSTPYCRSPRQSACGWRCIPTTRRWTNRSAGGPHLHLAGRRWTRGRTGRREPELGAELLHRHGVGDGRPGRGESRSSTRFGARRAICYVHFRDVRGVVPSFAECFLGEGNLDPAPVIKRLHERRLRRLRHRRPRTGHDRRPEHLG